MDFRVLLNASLKQAEDTEETAWRSLAGSGGKERFLNLTVLKKQIEVLRPGDPNTNMLGGSSEILILEIPTKIILTLNDRLGLFSF